MGTHNSQGSNLVLRLVSVAIGAKLLPLAQSSPQGQTVGENRLLTGVQEVIVVILGHFLDIVHFFAYRNHITPVFEDCYNSGQCATQRIY